MFPDDAVDAEDAGVLKMLNLHSQRAEDAGLLMFCHCMMSMFIFGAC